MRGASATRCDWPGAGLSRFTKRPGCLINCGFGLVSAQLQQYASSSSGTSPLKERPENSPSRPATGLLLVCRRAVACWSHTATGPGRTTAQVRCHGCAPGNPPATRAYASTMPLAPPHPCHQPMAAAHVLTGRPKQGLYTPSPLQSMAVHALSASRRPLALYPRTVGGIRLVPSASQPVIPFHS